MPTIDRTTNETVVYRSEDAVIHCNNGQTYVTITNASAVIPRHRLYKNWNRTANYRELVRTKQKLPDQPLDIREWRRGDGRADWFIDPSTVFCGGSFTGRKVGRNRTPYATYIGVYEGVQVLTNHNLIAKLLQRARDAEFSVPVFFGEWRQTAQMVINTARTVSSAYSNLRRGNLIAAAGALGISPSRAERSRYNQRYGRDPSGAAANKWLEYQYGWVPLLHDVKNAAETAAKLAEGPANLIGRVTSRDKLRTFSTQNVVFETVFPNRKSYLETIQDESMRAVWRFSPTDYNFAGSLGLTNPLNVAWQLLPLSFVIDWMLPIGRYIENLDVPLRFKHEGGCYGYRRKVENHYTRNERAGKVATTSYDTHYLRVDRSPMTQIPSLGLESIWWDPNIGASRVLSALSLARQRF